ncbi:MAG: polysaccharide deacetylase family protein [Halanaerobiaceae bacterium]
MSQGRYLIINADDFGMSHSTNKAILKLFKEGFVTSTSLMPTCPWFKEAITLCEEYKEIDVGVHLTFTSEWKYYKWRPLTTNKSVYSLVNEEGYLPASSKEVEKNAGRKEIKEEVKNQINIFYHNQVVPTSIDNHMGSLYGLVTGRSFLDIVFDFCQKHNLPFRYPVNIDNIRRENVSPEVIKGHEKIIQLAAQKDISLIDYLISLERAKDYNSLKKIMINKLKDLKEGITEIYLHPAIANEELKSITDNWQQRQFEFELLLDDDIKNIIKKENINLISWSEVTKI